MVYHAGLTSLGIIVDRCETPDHIRRMFVAISKIDTHAENKRNVLFVPSTYRDGRGSYLDTAGIEVFLVIRIWTNSKPSKKNLSRTS